MNMIKVINTVYACVKKSAADDDDFQRLSTGRWGGGDACAEMLQSFESAKESNLYRCTFHH